MLENSLFSTKSAENEAFVRWAEDYVLFLHVTSYVFDDPHHDLASERGAFGYPYCALLDSDGRYLAGAHGVLTLDAVTDLATRAEELLELSRSAEDDAPGRVMLARLQAEALSFEEAQAQLAALGDTLNDEQQAQAKQLVINREIAYKLTLLRRENPDHNDLRRAMVPAVVKLFEQGKAPSNRLAPHYFKALLGYASATKNRDMYQRGLRKMTQLLGEQENSQRLIQQYRDKLAEWEGGGRP